MNNKDNIDYWINNPEEGENRNYKQNLNFKRVNNKIDKYHDFDFNEKKRNKFNTNNNSNNFDEIRNFEYKKKKRNNKRIDYDNYSSDVNSNYRKPYNNLFVPNFYLNNIAMNNNNACTKVIENNHDYSVHNLNDKKIKLSINNMIKDKVHPLKSPSFFSQSKTETANNLLFNIKQRSEKFEEMPNKNMSIMKTLNKFMQITPSFMMNRTNDNQNFYKTEGGLYKREDIKSNFISHICNNQQKIHKNTYLIYNDNNKNKKKVGRYTKTIRPKTSKSDNKINSASEKNENILEKLDLYFKNHNNENINKTHINSCINNNVLILNIKTDEGIKMIKLSKNDNISSLIDNFCLENNISGKLKIPIINIINKAIDSLNDILFNNSISEKEINILKEIEYKCNESIDSTIDEEINLSCITVIDDLRENENNQEILNKTL